MLSLGLLLFACVVAAFLAYSLVQLALATSRGKSLPPGPATLPFLGNLHQLPTQKGYLKFQEWAKEYGPIVSLKVGSGNLIVLHSASAVRDLFDKRGAIYSSRPPSHIGSELIARDNTHLLLMPYGPEWRGQRKVYQNLMNINAVTSLQRLQNAESCLTLMQLLQTPAEYYDHIRRYSTAVILSSVFGVRGPHFQDPKVKRLYHVQDQFTAIMETGATPPVDVFPFLKSLPDFLSPWRKWALSIRKEQRSLYFELLQEVKDRLEQGISRNCFMDTLLTSEKSKHNLDEEHVAYVGGVLMEGGSDTTASTLLSFLLAMAKHPSILKKAQAEVDKICGDKRSPTFDDLDSLPYVKACATETMRWRPVAAGGIPHVLTQDDEYEGYKFAQGTIFLANTWAIHMDDEYYDAPEEFRPERFIKNEFGFKDDRGASEGLRKTYAFGAGRRICPGQHLAENSLHINMAKLVWAFDLSPGDGMSVEDIDSSIETAWTNGFLTAPKPFPLVISPRSPQRSVVIKKECESAGEVFREYGDSKA